MGIGPLSMVSKHILVTGGFGFLGSHLIEALLADPSVAIHVVDNLSSNPLPLEDLLHELAYPQNLSHTITTVEEFCKTWNGEPYDEIYHLASVVGPAGVLQHAGRIAAAIVNDTMAVVDLTMKCGARLLDVSTSEVYGGGQKGFCSETMPKIVPPKNSARLEYAVGKLAAETALLNLSAATGLDVRIVRPFNITGPRQSGKGGFVLPRFVGQALAKMAITVFGDGSQIRAFTHVKDMADGIVCAMKHGRAGEAYNLGNPTNRCSILELAEEVKKMTGTTSNIAFVDPKTVYGPLFEEANDKFPDAAKAFTELQWTPKHARQAVIADAVDYMVRLPERLQLRLRGF